MYKDICAGRLGLADFLSFRSACLLIGRYDKYTLSMHSARRNVKMFAKLINV